MKITSDLKPIYSVPASARANRILGCIRLAWHSNVSILVPSFLFKAPFFYSVLSHSDYCLVDWCPYYKLDVEVLEKVQRRMTRFIRKLKDLPYEECLKGLGLLTLFAGRIRSDLIFVYELLHCKINLDVSIFYGSLWESRERAQF